MSPVRKKRCHLWIYGKQGNLQFHDAEYDSHRILFPPDPRSSTFTITMGVGSLIQDASLNDNLIEASDEPVYSLAYISDAVTPFNNQVLNEIREVSERNNSQIAVTGILIYDDGSIIQILEGNESVVLDLLEKIKKDPRHQNLKVFAEGFAEERRLAGWSMAVKTKREIPPYMAGTCETLFRSMRNCPIVLGITDERIQFFQSLAGPSYS